MLYGEQNAHLRNIEQALGVDITCRGNELLLSGESRNKQQARAILEDLWQQVQKGQDIDHHSVDAALRFLDRQKDDMNGSGKNNGGGSAKNDQPTITTRKKKILPRTPMQADYIAAMQEKHMVFGIGPAGTGKTYIAVAMAVAMLEEGKIERIILSRPAVEAGERIGFLPGEMRDKMDPYMRPLYDSLYDAMAADKVQKKLASEEIEIAPLAFMRGRTLNNAFIILDEAQNATRMQMLMFLTRMGENSRMVITGDPSQIDLPDNSGSGLVEASHILADEENIGFVYFSSRDVVRNKLVAQVIKAYERRKQSKKT